MDGIEKGQQKRSTGPGIDSIRPIAWSSLCFIVRSISEWGETIRGRLDTDRWGVQTLTPQEQRATHDVDGHNVGSNCTKKCGGTHASVQERQQENEWGETPLGFRHKILHKTIAVLTCRRQQTVWQRSKEKNMRCRDGLSRALSRE